MTGPIAGFAPATALEGILPSSGANDPAAVRPPAGRIAVGRRRRNRRAAVAAVGGTTRQPGDPREAREAGPGRLRETAGRSAGCPPPWQAVFFLPSARSHSCCRKTVGNKEFVTAVIPYCN